MAATKSCVFCDIVARRLDSAAVLEDEQCFAFLDHRPLFPGHVLLVPRLHCETLADLPRAQIEPLFRSTQALARAVERAMGADGSFVAMNNRVSQSVPHLHVHIVPRRRGDGLRGFFWPRQSYTGPQQLSSVRGAIRHALTDTEDVS